MIAKNYEPIRKILLGVGLAIIIVSGLYAALRNTGTKSFPHHINNEEITIEATNYDKVGLKVHRLEDGTQCVIVRTYDGVAITCDFSTKTTIEWTKDQTPAK